MSLEVLNENGTTFAPVQTPLGALSENDTAFAPLNTAIDGDRDYRELTGFYQEEQLTPGMLGEAMGIGTTILWVGGAVVVGTLLWSLLGGDWKRDG